MKKERYNKWGQKLIAGFLAMMMILTTVLTNNMVSVAAAPTVTLSSKSETIAVGKSVQLKVKSVKGLKSKAVTWKSSNSKVAKVTSKGKVTGVTPGNAKITATSKSNKKVKATCKITVKKDAVQSIQPDKTACVIVKGKSAKVKVMGVEPSTASSKVTWKINKSSIGKVTVKGNTATVKGKKAGKATLTATTTDGSKKTVKVDIVVVNKKADIKKVSEVKVSLKQEEIFTGETTTAQVVVSPKQATLKRVFWSVDNKEIAEIDQTGKITGLKAGTVKITATSQDGSGKKATVTLTVKDKSQPTVIPTKAPEGTATVIPTKAPEGTATVIPTKAPEGTATVIPTKAPEGTATVIPTKAPEGTVTVVPTKQPEITETPEETWCETIEAAGKVVREQMKKRNQTIELHYKTSKVITDGSILNDIVAEALIHTGVSTEGDYLKWQLADWNATVEGKLENNVNYLNITYSMNYYTNNEQEAETDSLIATLQEQLNLQEKSDYQKIKAIYDYICSNVTYDYKNLNDDSYKLKYTAYAALVNGNAVCQGYANLLYRMLLEVGIDCRIITGISNGEAHAWNIVKLDNTYYYLDSTWDAQREKYSYFLKGSTDFDSHTSNEEYTTEEFIKAYPMAASKYVVSSTGNGVIEIRTEEELVEVANNPAGKYIMVNDIELSVTEWESLGDFQGEFDGNGYKITNLTSTKGKGLFTNLLEQAVVKNLTIDGNILTEEQSAALLAQTSYGKIVNCVTKGSVKQISGSYGNLLGSIVVYNYGNIEKCKNEAEIYGMMETSESNEWSTYCGGIVAVNVGEIIECENAGAVSSKSRYTGGIAGGNDNKAVISKCINTGKIMGVLDCEVYVLAVGGIVADNHGIISECENLADVNTMAQTNSYDVGGIVGLTSGYSEILSCINKGSVNGNVGNIGGICGSLNLTIGFFDEEDKFVAHSGKVIISKCKNYGEISGISTVEATASSVGGVVGFVYNMGGISIVKNCSNYGAIFGKGVPVMCGGVLGNVYLLGQGEAEFTHLINEGKVSAEWNENMVGDFYSIAGGVFGILQGNDETKVQTQVSKCANIGEVEGYYCYGVGNIERYIKLDQCYNVGNLNGYVVCGITDYVEGQEELLCCYNIGTLNGHRTYGIAQSVGVDSNMKQVYNAGHINGKEIEYGLIEYVYTNETTSSEELEKRENLSACYYLKQDFANENIYGTALDSTVIEQQESYEGFDFDSVWEMREQGGRKLPYLKVFDEIITDDFS